MTDTTPAPICRFPGCDDPVHAEGICLDHYQQFHGDAADTTSPAGQPQDAAPAAPAPSGRLRLSPLHAVVRAYSDGSGILGVYGVYGTPELAEKATAMLAGLGIPDKLETVPFYEVAP
jgi:hypothetical protein